MGLSLRKVHLWLGLVVALPVLAWSVSGFFLAVPPGAVQGEPYSVIEPQQVLLSPIGAMEAVEKHLGKPPELTSITLEQRGKRAVYSVFGKNGAFRVDAESGEVSKPPPPSRATVWIRNAHFFNFAGAARTAVLLGFSLLSACLALSGIWMGVGFLRKRASGSIPSGKENRKEAHGDRAPGV